LPSNLVTVGKSAFYNCSNLTQLVFPYTTTAVGEMAFCGCTSLTNVTFGASFATLGSYAFSNCTNLQSVSWFQPTLYLYQSGVMCKAYQNVNAYSLAQMLKDEGKAYVWKSSN